MNRSQCEESDRVVSQPDVQFKKIRIRCLLNQAALLLNEIDESRLSWLVEECADLVRFENEQIAAGSLDLR